MFLCIFPSSTKAKFFVFVFFVSFLSCLNRSSSSLLENTEAFTLFQCELFSSLSFISDFLSLDRLNLIQSGYILILCIWNACFFCIVSLKWKCLVQNLSSQRRIFLGIFSFISLLSLFHYVFFLSYILILLFSFFYLFLSFSFLLFFLYTFTLFPFASFFFNFRLHIFHNFYNFLLFFLLFVYFVLYFYFISNSFSSLSLFFNQPLFSFS